MGRVFSGIQPSGNGIPHLGNYLGSLKNWIGLQKQHECIFCVVDLHAITTPQKPVLLKNSILTTAASYVACGVDPIKSTIFQQSKVAGHSQLSWIFTTNTKMGWLNRMTQFKAKSGYNSEEKVANILEVAKELSNTDNPELISNILEKFENGQSDGIGSGLYMYPVLMAADILLYKATHVPVGDDQLQHLQLTKQIAKSFNNKFGNIFPIPQDIVGETGSRIMSLRNPDKKMSKSSMESEEEIIFLTDTADQISKKIKRATTDSDLLPSEADGLNGRFGAKNLLTIYAGMLDISLQEACTCFAGQGFGKLKPAVADAVIDKIVPIGNEIKKYMVEPDAIKDFLTIGAIKADQIANKTITEVYDKLGLS